MSHSVRCTFVSEKIVQRASKRQLQPSRKDPLAWAKQNPGLSSVLQRILGQRNTRNAVLPAESQSNRPHKQRSLMRQSTISLLLDPVSAAAVASKKSMRTLDVEPKKRRERALSIQRLAEINPATSERKGRLPPIIMAKNRPTTKSQSNLRSGPGRRQTAFLLWKFTAEARLPSLKLKKLLIRRNESVTSPSKKSQRRRPGGEARTKSKPFSAATGLPGKLKRRRKAKKRSEQSNTIAKIQPGEEMEGGEWRPSPWCDNYIYGPQTGSEDEDALHE